MSDKQNLSGGTGIMLAALAGAAVGAGVALLFAPRSGKDTREWLAHRSRSLKAKTMIAYEQGKNAVQQTAKELRKGDGDPTVKHDRPMYPAPGDPPTRR